MSADPADREQLVLQRSFAERVAEAAALPLPGHGSTRQRWRVLAEVAAEDMALAKLFESHADALAILAELDQPESDPAHRWAVWAAEPPTARLRIERQDGHPVLSGRKAWCSGADQVTHGLVTGWDDEGRQQLAAFELTSPGITVDHSAWQAVGMAAVPTPDLLLAAVPARLIGGPDQYVQRPGFWHGGCGIAACWYGGAVALGRAVRDRAAQRRDDPFLAAHLGAIDVAVGSLRALLQQTADWIDEHPDDSAAEHALRVRAAADATARLVSDHAGRALGAGPLCRDRAVARHFADLAVFIRQTHAERDLAELGRSVAQDVAPWQL